VDRQIPPVERHDSLDPDLDAHIEFLEREAGHKPALRVRHPNDHLDEVGFGAKDGWGLRLALQQRGAEESRDEEDDGDAPVEPRAGTPPGSMPGLALTGALEGIP
jgi:hypothetical protein